MIKLQLAGKSHAKRLRLSATAGVPKPLVVARLFLLREKLRTKEYVPYERIKDHVKCFCPNGHKAITKTAVKRVRKYVQNQLATKNIEDLRKMVEVNATSSNEYRKRLTAAKKISPPPPGGHVQPAKSDAENRAEIERKDADWMIRCMAGENIIPDSD
jgi:hypothetical protein